MATSRTTTSRCRTPTPTATASSWTIPEHADTVAGPDLFPSLVENNLVYGNGGKGIQVDWTDYATIRNNTAYHNNVDPLSTGTWHGELSNMNASHNTWVNNIAVADPTITGYNTAIDNTSHSGYINSDNIWNNNLTFNGTAGEVSIRNAGGNATLTVQDGNLLGVDPLLRPGQGFRIHPDSPAIDMGTRAHGNVSYDLFGNPRAGALDIGAHEAGESSPAGNNYLIGGPTSNTQYGYQGDDTLMGLGGSNSLRGGEGNNSLHGGSGNDFLDGGKGQDLLEGGYGRDFLVGNVGSDRFAFRAITESGAGAGADEIRDFSRGEGDKIDLSVIDANTKAYADQAFTFIGDAGFSKTPAELRYDHGIIEGDVNGDRVADFQIFVTNGAALTVDDFVL